MNKQLNKFINNSISGPITLIASGLTIGGYIFTYKNYFLYILLAIIVFVFIIIFYQKNKQKLIIKELNKQQKEINEKIRSIIDDINSYITQLKKESIEEIAQKIVDDCIYKVLCKSENIFRILTNYQCTVSLMLIDDDDKLYTDMYGSNAHPDRSKEKSQPLDSTIGIAGWVFANQKVRTWDDGDNDFVPIRENYKDYYLSGISAAIVDSSGFSIGIFNVDCKNKMAFDSKKHKDMMIILIGIINIITKFLELYEPDKLEEKKLQTKEKLNEYKNYK